MAVVLKVGEFKAAYKGQMELYLRWLDKFDREPDEASPLGIIVCTGKKSEQIELLELDKSGIHVAEHIADACSDWDEVRSLLWMCPASRCAAGATG